MQPASPTRACARPTSAAASSTRSTARRTTSPRCCSRREAPVRPRALRLRPLRRRDRRRPRLDADRAGEGRPPAASGATRSSPTSQRGRSDDPICAAVVDTVLRWDIPLEHFEAFLHSMTMDLTVTEYADLRRPLRVRLRFGRRDRAADGADPRAARPRGLRPRTRPRRRVPARELRPRRRRGPRPRPGLPAARGPRAASA